MSSNDADWSRWSVLREAFDDLAFLLPQQWQGLSRAPISCRLADVVVSNHGELAERLAGGICGGIRAVPWDARLTAGCDRDCALALVEVMFGGDGGEPALQPERPWSELELRSIKYVFSLAVAALQSAFAAIESVDLALENVEVTANACGAGSAAGAMLVAVFEIAACGRQGRLMIALPTSPLVSLRRRLQRSARATSAASEQAWSGRLMGELGRAEARLDAVLEGPSLTLAQVAQLRVGQTLRLPLATGAPVMLESLGRPLLRCALGQGQGRFTLMVEHDADAEQQPARG